MKNEEVYHQRQLVELMGVTTRRRTLPDGLTKTVMEELKMPRFLWEKRSRTIAVSVVMPACVGVRRKVCFNWNRVLSSRP